MRRNCVNCEHSYLTAKDEPCKSCKKYSNFTTKTFTRILFYIAGFLLVFGLYVLEDLLF